MPVAEELGCGVLDLHDDLRSTNAVASSLGRGPALRTGECAHCVRRKPQSCRRRGSRARPRRRGWAGRRAARGQVPCTARRRRDSTSARRPCGLLEPDVDRHGPPLDQAVGVEDQRRAGIELQRPVPIARLVAHSGHEAGHQVPAAPRRRRAGSADARRARARRRRSPGRASRSTRWRSASPSIAWRSRRAARAAGPGRRAVRGERADRRPQLPHRGGRLEAVADDVADRDADAPARQRERLVPVAADLEPLVARPVECGDATSGVATSRSGSSARCRLTATSCS